MIVHMALHKQQALFGIDAAGQQQSKSFQALFTQFGSFLPHCQRMQVSNKVGALVIFLQLLPVSHRANIITQCKGPRRLDAAEDNLFLFRFLNFLI